MLFYSPEILTKKWQVIERSTMQRLILIRHGVYGYDDRLNETGRQQMNEIAKKLQPTLNGGRVALLTSVAARARESADIIGKLIGVEPEEHDVLWSENRHRENLPKALELVRSKKDVVDVLILVTHLEYTERFPRYFAQEELGGGTFPHREVAKGEAWDIDCEQKTCTLIR